eukprot:GAHX01000884.1.p2 GENE.GAHX01000884.1~~GAHX01000884.1.p2  ORF type:complete len:287 (-),score=40.47 GAHX01000884.1:776-1636(-)
MQNTNWPSSSFGEIKIEWFKHLIKCSRSKNKPNNLSILLDKTRKEPKAITSFLHFEMNKSIKDNILLLWEKLFPEKNYKKCTGKNKGYVLQSDIRGNPITDGELLKKLFLFFLRLFKEPIYTLKNSEQITLKVLQYCPRNKISHMPGYYKINIARFMCFLMSETSEESISFETQAGDTTEGCMETLWRDVCDFRRYNKCNKYFAEVTRYDINMLYGEPKAKNTEGYTDVLYKLFHIGYLDLVSEEVEVEVEIEVNTRKDIDNSNADNKLINEPGYSSNKKRKEYKR